MDSKQFETAVNELGLDASEFLVIGSGILASLGLRNTDDVDLIVSKKVYSELEKTGEWSKKYFSDGSVYLVKGIYEVGLDWDSSDGKPNLAELKLSQVVRNGIPYVGLDRLSSWKMKRAKPKDLQDIELIKQYLSNQSGS